MRDEYNNDLAFQCLSFGTDFNFNQNDHVLKITQLLELNTTLSLKKEMYQKNFVLYEQELDRIVKSFQYQLVVYDESELFRQHTDSLFSYPYEQRKSILGKEQIFFKQLGHEAFTVSFSLSDVCLEGHYSDQIINVIKKTIDLIGKFWNSVIMQKDDDES